MSRWYPGFNLVMWLIVIALAVVNAVDAKISIKDLGDLPFLVEADSLISSGPRAVISDADSLGTSVQFWPDKAGVWALIGFQFHGEDVATWDTLGVADLPEDGWVKLYFSPAPPPVGSEGLQFKRLGDREAEEPAVIQGRIEVGEGSDRGRIEEDPGRIEE